MGMYWYALHVKAHKERTVHKHLRTLNIETFFPKLDVKPKNPRAGRQRPFFPGYLFVRVDLGEMGRNALRWTPGVYGLVTFGGEPAVVPERLVRELRLRLGRIQAAGELPGETFRQGDRVRVIRGPLEGYEAIFDLCLDGKQRVQVLLAFLSQHPQPVRLNKDDITKIK